MYICEPGLYVTSRLNRCRRSNILCNLHGAANTDFWKMAWIGLWSDSIVIFPRRDMYWLNLWQANTITRHFRYFSLPSLGWWECFWCKGYRLTVLKKDCAQTFFACITLKGDFCIAIVILENGVINHRLLYFLEGCVVLFSPCDLASLEVRSLRGCATSASRGRNLER